MVGRELGAAFELAAFGLAHDAVGARRGDGDRATDTARRTSSSATLSMFTLPESPGAREIVSVCLPAESWTFWSFAIVHVSQFAVGRQRQRRLRAVDAAVSVRVVF